MLLFSQEDGRLFLINKKRAATLRNFFYRTQIVVDYTLYPILFCLMRQPLLRLSDIHVLTISLFPPVVRSLSVLSSIPQPFLLEVL